MSEQFSRRDFILSGIAVAASCATAYAIANPRDAKEIYHDVIGDKPDEIPDTTPVTSVNEQNTCKDISALSIDEKIGLLVVPMASVDELDSLLEIMERTSVSNFALLGPLTDKVTFKDGNVSFADAITAIKASYQANKGMPVTLALDEEGGSVQRTKDLDQGRHALQSPQQMASLGPEQIGTIFYEHGKYLKTLGVTTVFGPLTDVGTHGADGDRAFSDDPNIVAISAGAAIEGLRLAGLTATAKHLPDNGQDMNNTDNSPGVVPDINTLRTTTLPAIGTVLTTNRPAYGMVGNYSIPGLTVADQPASMCPATYQLIRQEMGYVGAVMTDALNTTSIEVYTGAEDLIQSQVMASIEAISAGADMVIIRLDATEAVVSGLKAAISLQRLNDAAVRALVAKYLVTC